jgi:hypothetical protein
LRVTSLWVRRIFTTLQLREEHPQRRSMNKRLDFLKRKNQGVARFKEYENVFLKAGFLRSDLVPIELEVADKVIERVKEVFSPISGESQFISDMDTSFLRSDLLVDIYNRVYDEKCYLFTQDFQYCGLFLVETKKAINLSLKVSRNDIQNACFIVGQHFRFSLTINYYDQQHNDFPDSFEVQQKLNISPQHPE